MHRLPWLSLALVAAAVVVHAVPGVADGLIYDRALVQAGEWWRLTTAHVVHLSWPHLGVDALALLLAGAVAERRGRLAFGLSCGAAAIAAGLVVHRFSPEFARYAGLSAIAYAGLTHAALTGARDDRRQRVAWLALLGALAAKLVLEQGTGRPTLWRGSEDVRVASASHVAGALAAAVALPLWWTTARLRRSTQRFDRRRAAGACTTLGHDSGRGD